MLNLPVAAWDELQIPLAPLAEQNRIVDRIEESFRRVTAARERVVRVPAILKQFRQSVLAAASSGRLTADWRGANVAVQLEEELIECVQRDRNLNTARAKSTTGARPLKRAKHTLPKGLNSEFEVEAPESWLVLSLNELAVLITSGSRDWKRYYCNVGPGTFILAQNVRPLHFDRTFRQAVDPPALDRDRKRSEVRQGDILVTIVGANTGDVCRVAENVEQHYVSQSVALVRPALKEISAFLELYLNSPVHGKAQFLAWIYGEGRPH